MELKFQQTKSDKFLNVNSGGALHFFHLIGNTGAQTGDEYGTM